MSYHYGLVKKDREKEYNDYQVNWGYNFWDEFISDIEDYCSPMHAEWLDSLLQRIQEKEKDSILLQEESMFLNCFLEIETWLSHLPKSLKCIQDKYYPFVKKVIHITEFGLNNKISLEFWS